MSDYLLISLILITGMLGSVMLKKLDITGALAGGVTGFLVYSGAGYTGIFMMTAFFIAATIATSWKAEVKKALHLEEQNRGRRTAGQVLANAVVAGLCGILAFLYPQEQHRLVVMMAGAFASATSDTLSSELGNIYGRRFYNIISWKKDTRGLDGVISIEGTAAGITGSALIGVIYALGFGWTTDFFIIVAAGTIGNVFDSILGATLERKKYLGNNGVNFLNTAVAAGSAFWFKV